MCANPMLHRQMAASQFLVPTQQRHFAASEKELKQRMKTVNNIRKITKAMKMVATSKMKADLKRLLDGKNFGVSSVDMMFTWFESIGLTAIIGTIKASSHKSFPKILQNSLKVRLGLTKLDLY